MAAMSFARPARIVGPNTCKSSTPLAAGRDVHLVSHCAECLVLFFPGNRNDLPRAIRWDAIRHGAVRGARRPLMLAALA